MKLLMLRIKSSSELLEALSKYQVTKVEQIVSSTRAAGMWHYWIVLEAV